jgi:arsenate reductase
MAEGYLRHFAGDSAIIRSAGVEVHGVNPRAVRVMQEEGIDISQHTSNNVDEYSGIHFDFVITVCDSAKERCPVFPSHARKFHQDFPDPAKASGSEEQILDQFRRTRNMIREYCEDFVKTHLTPPSR